MTTTATEPQAGLVERVLEADGERTRELLLSYLPDEGARSAFYDLVADYPTRPSKGIRPALCLATCRAYGGRSEDAEGIAVAIEMLHNAFLVHDDICDDAQRRRGEEALHVRHGVPLALSAGDALASLALGPLLDSARTLGPRTAIDLLDELREMTRRTVEGQANELAWRERDLGDLEVADYLDLVRDKTCWYSAIHPCRAGALIGSRGRADLDPVARFGFFLGALLQIRDDVENVTDHGEAHGKDFGSDIVEGKPTLLVIHLLQNAGGATREEASRLLSPASRGVGVEREGLIERVVELMESSGAIDYACAFADGLAGAALAELEVATADLPESPDKSFLRSLVLHLRDPAVRGR